MVLGYMLSSRGARPRRRGGLLMKGVVVVAMFRARAPHYLNSLCWCRIHSETACCRLADDRGAAAGGGGEQTLIL